MKFSKDALELLLSTARKAAEARVLELSGDGRHVHVAQNGSLTAIAVRPGCREHVVRTLDDLAAYAVAAAKAERAAGIGPPVVFYDASFCILLLDDADRRDRVVLPLDYSKSWLLLQEYADEKPMLSQRDAIKALRLVFGADPALIAAFRRIDLKSAVGASSVVNRGKESLGKAIEQEIVNAAEIPETITLDVPIYRNHGEDYHYSVACAVELDAVNGLVQIVPEPGRLDEILHLHMSSIAMRLLSAFKTAGVEIAVYYGSP